MDERRVESAATLARIEQALEDLKEAINGNPHKEIDGIRTRLRTTEADVKKLIRMVEQDKVPERVKTLEDLVESLMDERKRYKAWIAGLVAGLGVTTVTSAAGFVLQLIQLANATP
jgi:predicted  nucleic acid-binding Zn-ribbon protein